MVTGRGHSRGSGVLITFYFFIWINRCVEFEEIQQKVFFLSVPFFVCIFEIQFKSEPQELIYAFGASFLLDLGAPLHKTILPSQHTTVPNVSILAQTHSPAIWGVPQSPYTVSCSLAASLVSFLVKPIPSSRVHLKHLLPIPS